VPAESVRRFLLQFKQAATRGSGVDIVPRQETLATLASFGLTKANLEQLLLGLSVTDYSEGPVRDYDRPGQLWVFGKDIKGQEVYIKLKVARAGNRQVSKCISFHIAQRPMRYPLR